MLYVLFTVTALCQLAFSTPIHSSGGGVTECQDGLFDWMTKQTTNPTHVTCASLSADLESILGSCRPSDTLYMTVLLDDIFNKYYRPLGCKVVDISDCAPALQCIEPMFADELMVTLGCDECSKTIQNDAVFCLREQVVNCSMADILQHTITSAVNAVCSGPACVGTTGVLQSEPGTACQKWAWMYNPGGRRHVFNVAAGTMWSAEDCAPVFKGAAECFN